MKISIKTIRSFIIASLTVLAISSCKEEVSADQQELDAKIPQYEALKKEAMEVHDIVMPKMSSLMEYKGKLKAHMTDSIQNNEFNIAQTKLQEAHDGMMEWMRDYSDKFPYGEETPETLEAINERMPVLEQEVEEIKDLRNRTDKTIEYAEELLAAIQNKDAA